MIIPAIAQTIDIIDRLRLDPGLRTLGQLLQVREASSLVSAHSKIGKREGMIGLKRVFHLLRDHSSHGGFESRGSAFDVETQRHP